MYIAGYDVSDEIHDGDPLVAQVDVAGLYRPELAAVASRATACDPGSGPCRLDD